jgi:hypothetical protein
MEFASVQREWERELMTAESRHTIRQKESNP